MRNSMLFVVTVDDAGLSQSKDVETRSIRFFESQRVPASFFAIPETAEGRGLVDDPGWVSRARSYEASGFDYQLHSYRHEGFEFGAPEHWMVQICGVEAIEEEAKGYPTMRRSWADEVLRGKLRKAIAAFERAFGRRPQVFRAGCLAAGADAFRLMGEEGLLYDSDKVTDPKSWDYIAQQFDSPRPWDPAVPPYPYRIATGVVELPCIGEYAWTLSPETLHHFKRLAVEDMERVHRDSGVFVLMCHQQRVGADDELPREVLRHVFDVARKEHGAEFVTLRDLVAKVESGAVAVR
jgi:peptidoglycan/xylan/chitin deacetylase (PgdA/CDA1 family)